MMQASTTDAFKLRGWVSLIWAAMVLGVSASQSQVAAAQGQPAVENQEPAYKLNLQTQLVTLDVVVNDKKGEPVRGLTQGDFTVYEDKVAKPIVSFEAVAPPSSDGRTPVSIHSTAELDKLAPQAPVSILVLDELTTRFEDQYFARYSLERYLSKQGETLDQPMTLIARTYHGPQVLLDYTTSKKELLGALTRHLATNDFRATDPTAPEDKIIAEFASLIEIAKATQGHPGHKSLIWIGRGFPSLNRNGNGEAANKDKQLDAAIAQCTNLLRDARVTLYTIDPAGVSAPEQSLDAAGDVLLEDPFGSQVSFMEMAAATGGQALHGRNDVDRAIDTTVRDGQTFYSLAYRPSTAAANDNAKGFRNIRVEVKGGQYVAITREGYYLPKAGGVPEPGAGGAGGETAEPGKLSADDRFNLAAASQGLMVFDAIPITVTREGADVFHLAFPAANVGLTDDGSKLTGRVSVIVLSFDKAGKLVERTGKIVSLHLAPLEQGVAESRKVEVTTTLKTGAPAVRVRFIVLGNGNGKIGAENLFLVDRKTLKQ